MSLSSLIRFLFGSRRAILALAGDPRTAVVGFVFVISAAVAREYDGEDLLAEPGHLLVPVAASLAASFALYGTVCLQFRWERVAPPFWRTYWSFLGLFWMTAPLAWLYAIPVERFLPPLEATQANLCLLAVVSLWRVALAIRIVQVLFDATWGAVPLVLFYAASVGLAAALAAPWPLIELMGGLRRSPSEELLVATTRGLASVCLFAIPLCGIAMLVERFLGSRWYAEKLDDPQRSHPWGMYALAALSLAVWIPILPHTQAEQQLRRRVEQSFEGEDIPAAMRALSARRREEFPPHWEPPYRWQSRFYPRGNEKFLKAAKASLHPQVPQWIKDVYAARLAEAMQAVRARFLLSDEDLLRLLQVVSQIPEGPELVARHRSDLEERLAEMEYEPDNMDDRNEDARERYRAQRELAENIRSMLNELLPPK